MLLQIRRRIPARLLFWGLCLAALYAYSQEGHGPRLEGQTYYVRVDGGDCDQCTGLVDAPYPGSGLAQPCAWDHPFRALPPNGEPKINGGDTLIIASGSYMLGLDAPGAENCDAAFPWDCFMCAVPSGPSPSQPTRILGKAWDQGCLSQPELWGSERSNMVINLTGSNNVEVRCLEITDHSGCVEFHAHGAGGSAWTCERDNFPYGPWASTGLYAEDSSNVILADLHIHGLATTGIWAGRLTDWTVDNVQITGNGWVGWDGDIPGDDSNTGTLLFRNWTVSWNGCSESWPDGEPQACWGQSVGGYGDGVGTGATTGHWMIQDSAFIRNTSDGLDLLYLQPGGSVTLDRVFAEGNAGNQIKTRGPAVITNTLAVGNCSFFEGQPFTYNVDNCRAQGNAISTSLGISDQVTITNSTIAGEGDCLVIASCDQGCSAAAAVVMRNNIFQGYTDFLQPFEATCFFYHEGFPSDPLDEDFGLIDGVKNSPCPGPNDICGQPTGLLNLDLDHFDGHLGAQSPAVDSGDPISGTAIDLEGITRPQDGDGDGFPAVDRGAYERVIIQPAYYLWRSQAGDPSYDPAVDGDGNGIIDVRDFIVLMPLSAGRI